MTSNPVYDAIHGQHFFSNIHLMNLYSDGGFDGGLLSVCAVSG